MKLIEDKQYRLFRGHLLQIFNACYAISQHTIIRDINSRELAEYRMQAITIFGDFYNDFQCVCKAKSNDWDKACKAEVANYMHQYDAALHRIFALENALGMYND